MEPWRARLRTLLHGEAGTIAHLTRDLSWLVNGVEKFNARQRDQAPTRERHGRCLSRRNRCRLIHPGRNGAHHRLYVRGRLGWPPFSHTRSCINMGSSVGVRVRLSRRPIMMGRYGRDSKKTAPALGDAEAVGRYVLGGHRHVCSIPDIATCSRPNCQFFTVACLKLRVAYFGQYLSNSAH